MAPKHRSSPSQGLRPKNQTVNLNRLRTTASLEVRRTMSRPMFWFFLLLLGLLTWSFATGSSSIRTGNPSADTGSAWLNSEFSLSLNLSFVAIVLYIFFTAIAAGTTLIRDDELGVGEVLFSTGLQAREYVWGKFLGLTTAFLVAALCHLAFMLLFFEVLPSAAAGDLTRGPFLWAAYLRPTALFILPPVVFFLGGAFAIGARWRQPIAVFFLPVASFLACLFFFWRFRPDGLSPGLDRWLVLLDPTGYRWLFSTWLDIDRGVDFYNQVAPQVDGLLLSNRAGLIVAGIALVGASVKHGRPALGSTRSRERSGAHGHQHDLVTVETAGARLASRERLDFGSRSRPDWRSAFAQLLVVEVKVLRRQPALFLFAPLIVLQVIAAARFEIGTFNSEIIQTSGLLAVRSMDVLTTLLCLLLTFTLVEAFERERTTRFEGLLFSTPAPTSAILISKLCASLLLVTLLLSTALIASLAVLAVDNTAPIELYPFILLWGCLLLPTFIFWGAFVTLAMALVGERYKAYALCLGALAAFAWLLARGDLTWATDWTLWSVLNWSDLGALELDRTQLILNRLGVTAAALALLVVARHLFSRRTRDPARLVDRLRPVPMLHSALRLVPVVLLPLGIAIVLALQVEAGEQGTQALAHQKDYWRQNQATWKGQQLPTLERVELDVRIEPNERRFAVDGNYLMRNHLEEPFRRIALTAGPQWQEVSWTLNDTTVVPEDRSGLVVFRPPKVLDPGERITIGFRYHGTLPSGASRRGGGRRTFILPSGVVLHSYSPEFIPFVGFYEGYGIDEDTAVEPRTFRPGFHHRVLPPVLGSPEPFDAQLRIDVPARYTANSVGRLTSSVEQGGRRVFEWRTDHPVRAVNVVAGQWEMRRKGRTSVFFHPAHHYNVDEIADASEAALTHFSDWFHPYPWQELKISEFPDLARYAQAFPTNITFSEGVGFLTASEPRRAKPWAAVARHQAFMITAHEAAHQWWGHLVTPGKGPGSMVLSEGMAQYSALLLQHQVFGLKQRIEFSTALERRYLANRRIDVELPLVEIAGTRSGDTTVMYEKGGWAMWMLHNLLGEEATRGGLQAFFEAYIGNPDHPALEDLLATLSPFAPDSQEFERFTDEWYREVVLPEFRFSDTRVNRVGDAYLVETTIQNTGSGSARVFVAAQAGERFPLVVGLFGSDYREAKQQVLLGPGRSETIRLWCDFEPQILVADPDALVLQAERHAARVDLTREG